MKSGVPKQQMAAELGSAEIAKNVFLHTTKVPLRNTEDLAHTLYTYTVIAFHLTYLNHRLKSKKYQW